jgi:hypothetical protein
MAIGLRMQVTPLQMALVAGAVGRAGSIGPRLLLALDGAKAAGAGHRRSACAWTASRRHEGRGRCRHRRRRLPRRRAWRRCARPVWQDRHRARSASATGHRLVHRLAGAGQPARPAAPAGLGGLRQPLGGTGGAHAAPVAAVLSTLARRTGTEGK